MIAPLSARSWRPIRFRRAPVHRAERPHAEDADIPARVAIVRAAKERLAAAGRYPPILTRRELRRLLPADDRKEAC